MGRDAESMVRVMTGTLEDEAGLAALGRRALARSKEYSWEKSARAVIDLLERLDGKK